MAFPETEVKVTKGAELLGEYKSSEGGSRFFCKTCGGRAYNHIKPIRAIAVHPSTFDFANDKSRTDVPENFKPRAHVYYADRVPGTTMRDGLPKFVDRPAQAGGSGKMIEE